MSVKENLRYHTNFHVIESKVLPKNNRSGCKGVCWDAHRKRWAAYISVHGKRIHLGRYNQIEDAVKARRQGEDEYFLPLIEQKAAEKVAK
mgnify:CR=1 FL=1